MPKKVLDTKKGQQVENVTSIGMSGQWFESFQIQIDHLKKKIKSFFRTVDISSNVVTMKTRKGYKT